MKEKELPEGWHWCDRLIDARYYASNNRLEVTVYKSGDVETYSRHGTRKTESVPLSVIIAVAKANGVEL